MCGIAGAVGETRESVVEEMLSRINHRGPDDRGFARLDTTMLGNVRLSIIDLAGGHQPMRNTAGNLTIVYNGELYGYGAIRASLKQRGYHFVTKTDTEVLLAGITMDGLEFVSSVNGMFAFALHDHRTGTTVIARDHLGIKPLLYTSVNSKLYFASEAKAFYAVPEWNPQPDWDAWNAFFNIRFPPAPRTLFKGVYKVPPGCMLVVSSAKLPGTISPSLRPEGETIESFPVGEQTAHLIRYWSRPAPDRAHDTRESTQELRRILENSVADQMIADVDVGVYLSGGIDSSTVAVLAARSRQTPVNSICLGFNEPTDENSDASLVSKHVGTYHRDIFLSEQPLDYFDEAVFYMEEPKVNCLQGYLLAREARKHQKVMLSGLGGDELFGGYDIYAIANWLDRLKSPLVTGAMRPLGALGRALASPFTFLPFDNVRRGLDIVSRLRDPLQMYLLLRNVWDHDKALFGAVYSQQMRSNLTCRTRDLFNRPFPESDSLAGRFMLFEQQYKMVDDFLANEDRMSMAHGLESRVPLLDRRVVDFSATLPTERKLSGTRRKIILKDSMAALLPGTVQHKRKHGFTFDPVLQFKKDLASFASRTLNRERVESSGVFNYSFVKKILDSKPGPSLRWHYFLLWKIAGFHVWEDTFIRNKPPVRFEHQSMQRQP